MNWEITEEEISTTSKLSAEDRYTYFVEKTLEHGKIWSLKNEDGWVLGEATEEIEAIPAIPEIPERMRRSMMMILMMMMMMMMMSQ